MLLSVVRTGSAWTRTAAYWAGQAESTECELCGQEEKSDHIWTCPKLEGKRRELDVDLAELDPKMLPAPVRQGVAPAMKADPRAPFWGGNHHNHMNEKQKELCGCRKGIPKDVDAKTKNIDNRVTAREVMQAHIETQYYEQLGPPAKCSSASPDKPNVYTDGSLKNIKGLHWSTGGCGLWWPNRRIEEKGDELNDIETKYLHHEQDGKGL